jgi:hypothetical protein
MKAFALGMMAVCWFGGPASAQIAVSSEEGLKTVKSARTAVLHVPNNSAAGGWNYVAYYKGCGDKCSYKTAYMTPFTKEQEKALKDLRGTYTCVRRDKANYTKGSFHFWRDDKGKPQAAVNRAVQLPKAMSTDLKNLADAGKFVAKALGVYFKSKEIEGLGPLWANAVHDVRNVFDDSKRADNSPTIVGGQERWTANEHFTLTVARYYNCALYMRYE